MALSGLYNSYQNLWKSLIMPPRQEYTIQSLGPPEFNLQGHHIKRADISLTNKNNISLACSFFHHVDPPTPLPCVIYLHANGCTRMESYEFMKTLLLNDINLFCFDFPGCGKSGGTFTSLGYFEQDDLDLVIQYLRSTGKVGKIAVWGRSMGAVTALLYATREPSYKTPTCLVLDSGFASFKRLFKEQAKQKASIPNLVSEGAYGFLKMTIEDKANFDINALKPIKTVGKIRLPALFGASKQDKLVDHQHTQDLFDAYEGTKKIFYFGGEHNGMRPSSWVMEVIDFLKVNLFDNPKPRQSLDASPKKFPSSPNHLQTNEEEVQEKHKVKELNISPIKMSNYKGIGADFTPTRKEEAASFSKHYFKDAYSRSNNTSKIFDTSANLGPNNRSEMQFNSSYTVENNQRRVFYDFKTPSSNYNNNSAIPKHNQSSYSPIKPTHQYSHQPFQSQHTTPIAKETIPKTKIENFSSALNLANNSNNSNQIYSSSSSPILHVPLTRTELPQSTRNQTPKYVPIVSPTHAQPEQQQNQTGPRINKESKSPQFIGLSPFKKDAYVKSSILDIVQKGEQSQPQSFRDFIPPSPNQGSLHSTSTPVGSSKHILGNMMQKLDLTSVPRVEISLAKGKEEIDSLSRKNSSSTFDHSGVPKTNVTPINSYRGENPRNLSNNQPKNGQENKDNSFSNVRYRHAINQFGVVESKKIYTGIPLDHVREAFGIRTPI